MQTDTRKLLRTDGRTQVAMSGRSSQVARSRRTLTSGYEQTNAHKLLRTDGCSQVAQRRRTLTSGFLPTLGRSPETTCMEGMKVQSMRLMWSASSTSGSLTSYTTQFQFICSDLGPGPVTKIPTTFFQCSGSMTFWGGSGSGSSDPCF
jgi:hypothetical protein